MKRKLLSFAVAFMLLLQTVASAGALFDHVQTIKTLRPGVFDGDKFSWTKFVDLSDPKDKEDGGVVQAQLTGGVALGGSSSFAATQVLSSYSSSFDYKLDIDMTNVKNTFNNLHGYAYAALSGDTALQALFDNSSVNGKFTIEVTYDAGITPPSVAFSALTLEQNGAPATIYAVNTTESVNDTSNNKITVVVDANTRVSDLNADPTLLNDLTITVPGWGTTVQSAGIIAKMDGNTIIEEPAGTAPSAEEYAIIEYHSDPTGVNVSVDSGEGGGSHRSSGGGGSTIPPVNPDIEEPNPVDPDGDEIDADITENPDGTLNITPKREQKSKKGKIPNGYSDKPYQPADPDYDPENPGTITGVEPNEDGSPVVLYPRYVNSEVPSALRGKDTDVHNHYIVGYPDGEVKPNNNITREEVTAAFYRLLESDFRAGIETTEHSFPDVAAERWSNASIATMANGGFIVGDTEGNFNPARPITRAEFAVIASKFIDEDAQIEENYFLDIDNHWAKDYILKVAEEYWVSGYTDRTFNPDAYITRAEAMTIINRMLVRYGDVDSEYAIQWPDVSKSDWYYQSVIEATTDHKYERKANGWSETWLAY